VKFLTKDRQRAKFELTRLVAMAWTPCELKRVGVSEEPWNPLLKCLGINDAQACQTSSYSETGWAVSSAIAAQVAPPHCTLPAFSEEHARQCVKSVSFAQSESFSPILEARR
jgi:hypothetical protein